VCVCVCGTVVYIMGTSSPPPPPKSQPPARTHTLSHAAVAGNLSDEFFLFFVKFFIRSI